jgi:hypothetical protein
VRGRTHPAGSPSTPKAQANGTTAGVRHLGFTCSNQTENANVTRSVSYRDSHTKRLAWNFRNSRYAALAARAHRQFPADFATALRAQARLNLVL